ncbi:hypothetical protein [Demequina lutea]|uniref:Uncharacterized protein n=1 Tax=Demequina lutea TaxID=431489 RepID=A0A7Y9ZD53_9MICO|nr:hypothetical protein [Demequina lutea]NYI42408.1 hypothetical protein [Demequina lutea]
MGPTEPYVVPDLPWEVPVTSDAVVLGALSNASRAIGRLEGQWRSWLPSTYGLCALASIEAWSCVLAEGETLRWGAFAKKFSASETPYGRPTNSASTATCLLGFHLGLQGYAAASHHPIGAIRNEFLDVVGLPPRLRSDFDAGLPDWLAAGPVGSGILRAILAMMSVAASCPDSPSVAMAARASFPWMLSAAHGADVLVPISVGFVDYRDDWQKVARALAGPNPCDPGEVNEALVAALRAVERAAVTATFELEVQRYRERTVLTPVQREWFESARPSTLFVARLIAALPSASRKQLDELTGFTTRTINSAVRALEAHGLIAVDGGVRGVGDYVVVAKQRWVPMIAAVNHYPSVSGGHDG